MARATGKDHAEINLAIWGDDDWLDLTPPAQHLYFVLWTSAQLSYCGTGEWHPGRIAALAKGWTAQSVELAGVELSTELFLIVDTDTEEFLLRSWVKHDGIWKKPNMAVSMANARSALASRTLRGVIVHEVQKVKARNMADAKTGDASLATGWQRDAVKQLLSQKAIDPATLPPFTPRLTPALTPGVTPPLTPALTVRPGVGVNPPSNPGPTPSPAPFSSSILQSGYVTGERHQASEPDPNDTPPRFCPEHMPDGTPKTCPDCIVQNRVWTRWRDNASRAADDAQRQAALDAAAEREAEAVARALAIVNCDECDDDGYRAGLVCAHNPGQVDTITRGMAAVRAALAKTGTDDA